MQEVYAYRLSVDQRMEDIDSNSRSKNLDTIEVGLHEEQHQELFYTEIKYILHQNPLALREPYQKQNKKLQAEPSEAKIISSQAACMNLVIWKVVGAGTMNSLFIPTSCETIHCRTVL